jgi:hypothetical protein
MHGTCAELLASQQLPFSANSYSSLRVGIYSIYMLQVALKWI